MLDGKQHWTCYQCFNTRRGSAGRGRHKSSRFLGNLPQGAVGGAAGGQAAGGDSRSSNNVKKVRSMRYLVYWGTGRIIFVATKEIKGGICFGGHLTIMYEGELLYLWMFLLLIPPSK